MEAASHETILWAVAGVTAIFLSICIILFNMISSIKEDHVRRIEFEALRSRVDIIATNQAAIRERLDDTRCRLSDVEKES